MKMKPKCKCIWIACIAVLALCTTMRADPPLPGAIFTTDSTCTGVDLNIYAQKSDVYIDGGPAHPGAAGLPDGYYCVQVTNPGGSVVLGRSPDATAVHVTNGEFDECYQLTSILRTASSGYTVPGYDDTDNPGGEYKVWVSTDCNFNNNSTKTDNFKVREGQQPETATLCVHKFCDANANGVFDSGDTEINGWQFQLFAHDNLILVRDTMRCMVLDPGDYRVLESNSTAGNWIHTTPTNVAVTLDPGETENVYFGNVCLGQGGGFTLGFWSNRNGQRRITPADINFLSGLCLRNANGSDFNPSNAAALGTWLLSANATNMAYMLSAQLAAMELNVRQGFVSGSALVYAGDCGNTGYNNQFITVNDLMAAAETALCADGMTPAGDPNRALQECLKNALDKANNNQNFVQGDCSCAMAFPVLP